MRRFLYLVSIFSFVGVCFAASPRKPIPGIVQQYPTQGSGGAAAGPALTIAYNEGWFETGAGTSLTCTPVYKPKAGNVIFVGSWVGTSSFTSVIDSSGGVFQLDKFDNRDTGNAVGIWHRTATGTMTGTYNIIVTPDANSNINVGILTASNTAASVSVDVTTDAFRTTAIVEIGTSAATTAATDLVFSVFSDNSGSNDAITPRSPLTEVAEFENGTSGAAGAVAYSTTSVASTPTKGNWTLAGSKRWNSITAAFKTP